MKNYIIFFLKIKKQGNSPVEAGITFLEAYRGFPSKQIVESVINDSTSMTRLYELVGVTGIVEVTTEQLASWKF